MQRSTFVLFLLSLASVSFLWLQIFVLSNIEHSRKDIFIGFVSSFISRGWTENEIVNNRFLAFLQDFHNACLKNRVNTTFITDPIILQSILGEQQNSIEERQVYGSKQCLHFCNKNSVSLGILATHWNNDVLHDLKNKDIDMKSVTGRDPILVEGKERTVPFHFFFTRHKLVIHVTMLYERGVLGLWYGPIFQPNPSFYGIENEKSLASIEHFQNEGVLNTFSLNIATVDGLTVSLPSEIDFYLRDLSSSMFLPCNIKRAQEFYSKYGDDESNEAIVFRKRGKHVLQIAKTILDNLGVRFWLSSGTCLGWFRQCNVISHGKDMDIGIWIKDYNKQLIEEFHRNGLYLEHVFGKVKDSFQISFRTIDDVKLDIFFFYEEGTYMWNGGTQAKSGKKFKYIFPNFSLCWTEFLGMKVRVPCETQAYIEANYGRSWAVPIKQWDWKKSPPNVIENGKWGEKDLPEVIQFFELQ